MIDFIVWLSCIGLVVSVCLLAMLSIVFRLLFGFHMWNEKEMKEFRDALCDD